MVIQLYDDFNRPNSATIANGWTLGIQSNGSNTLEDYSIKSNITGSGADYRVFRSFTASTPTYIRVRVRTTVPSGNGILHYLRSGGATVNPVIFFGQNGTQFQFNSVLTGTLAANTWYTLECRNIDWGTRKFDGYVDGVLVASQVSLNGASTSIDTATVEDGSSSAFVGYTGEYVICDTESEAPEQKDRVEIYTNTSQGDVRGALWESMIFKAAYTAPLSFVQLWGYRTGSPGTVTVELRSVDGISGLPTATVLATGSFNGNNLTTSSAGQYADVTFGTPYRITRGTKYALVVSAPTGSAGNDFLWSGDSTSAIGTYPTDYAYRANSTNSGSGWTQDTTKQWTFKTYKQGIKRENIAAWYRLEADAEDYHLTNDLTVAGTATQNTTYPWGIGSYAIPGTGGSTLKNSTNLGISGGGSMSISFWVYFDSLPGISGTSYAVVDLRSNAGAFDRYDVLQIHNGAGTTRWRHDWTGTAFEWTTAAVLSGQWYHVVFTRTGVLTHELYVNGVSLGANTNGSPGGGSAQNWFSIGNGDNSSLNFTGKIAQCVVLNRAVTASEVTELFNTGLGQVYGYYAPMDEGMFHYWNFNTDYTDSAGYTKTGTPQSGVSITTASNYLGGSGAEFTGSTSYISYSNTEYVITYNRPWSIGGWFYLSSNKVATLFSHRTLGSPFTPLNLTIIRDSAGGGVVSAFLYDTTVSSTTYVQVASPALNTWTHVIFTYDGTRVRGYYNGVLQTPVAESLGTTGATGTSTNMTLNIGRNSNGATSQDWQGYIDEAFLANRCFNAGEVRKMYNLSAGRLLSEIGNDSTLLKGLMSYWKFDGDIANARGSFTTADSGTTTTGTGIINQGRTFDATTDFISTTLPALVKSIGLWVHPTVTNNGYMVKAAGSNVELYFTGGNNIAFYDQATTLYKQTTATYAANAWYFIVATADGATLSKLYVNGVEVTSFSTNTLTATSWAPTSGTWKLGNYTTNTIGILGVLDETGAWMRDLAITEVIALYNAGAANQYPFVTGPAPVVVTAQRSFTGVLF